MKTLSINQLFHNMYEKYGQIYMIEVFTVNLGGPKSNKILLHVE